MKNEIKEILSGYPEVVQWLSKEIYGNFYNLLITPTELFNPQARLYWVYLSSFILVAVLFYAIHYECGQIRHCGTFSLKKFLNFCFPKRIYLHPSAIVDYKLYVANRFFRIPRSLFLLYTEASVIYAVTNMLNNWIGPNEQRWPLNWWTILTLTIIVIIIKDLGSFIDHAMEHYIPLLWPLHSVHHSAEVLTPITQYRGHPLSSVAAFPIVTTLSGLLQGILFYLIMDKPEVTTIAGLNAVQYLFNLIGSNLRHSHIWFSFGPVLSCIFISPAQHQIHHSAAPQHWNKNFGEIFAFWDWMFGTLYIPKEKEDLVFGLGESQPQAHSSLMKAYFQPLVDIYGILSSVITDLSQPDRPGYSGRHTSDA